MASWTDNPQLLTQFNEYTPQQPVDAMLQVGLQKQNQYEQGVQRIQQQIDNVAGIDVVKDADKAYLQSKLNEVGNKLKFVAAGDFSNYQLQNSVGGMVNSIAKDVNIQNAASSTIWYKNQMSKIENDISEGKSDPANIDYFQKKANKWLSSDKPGEKFNAQYLPYFDVFKFTKETFDAVKPDGLTYDQVFETDMNGNPVRGADGNFVLSSKMVRYEQEGISTEKVKQTLAQIMSDPRVSQQLDITGQYTYKNSSPDMIAANLDMQKSTILDAYNQRLTQLGVDKALGKDVSEEMDAIQSATSKINSNFNQYLEILSSGNEDAIDAIRGQLYKSDIESRYTTMFSYNKTKETVHSNPAWQANFDLQKEANSIKRWQIDRQDRIAKNISDYDLELLKMENKGSKNNSETPGATPEDFTQADQSSSISTSLIFDADQQRYAQEFTDASDELIWIGSISEMPGIDLEYKKLIDQGNTPEQAIKRLIREKSLSNLNEEDVAQMTEEEKDDYVATQKATIGEYFTTNFSSLAPSERNDKLVNAFNRYAAAKQDFDNFNKIKQRIDTDVKNQVGQSLQEQIDSNNIKPQKAIVNGEEIELTKGDIADLALYLKGNASTVFGFLENEQLREESNRAYKRLSQKGLVDLADEQLNEFRYKNGFATPPVTGLVTTGKKAIKGIGDNFMDIINSAATGLSPTAFSQIRENSQFDNKQLFELTNKLNNSEISNALDVRSKAIQKYYNIRPDLSGDLFTGEKEIENSQILEKVRRFANNSVNGQKQNLGLNIEDFATTLNDSKVEDLRGRLTTNIKTSMDGSTYVELELHNKSGEVESSIVLQPDEAISLLGKDINTLFVPNRIGILKANLNSEGRTSRGNPNEVSTYLNDDVAYRKENFPNLKNARNLDVKANLSKDSQGGYYIHIFAMDNDRMLQKPRVKYVGNDLLKAEQTLLSLDPTYIQVLLNQPQ